LSIPDKTSTVQTHGEFTYREINSDVLIWGIKPNSWCVVEVVVSSVAGLVAFVERRVINSSLIRVINSGDSDGDSEAADENDDCCVVDVRPVVGLDRK
jgi:hypothetical protein